MFNKCVVYVQRLLGIEIHAVSSCTKPIAAWTCRDAIQECREACGGHGYLKGESSPLHVMSLSYKYTTNNINFVSLNIL